MKTEVTSSRVSYFSIPYIYADPESFMGLSYSIASQGGPYQYSKENTVYNNNEHYRSPPTNAIFKAFCLWADEFKELGKYDSTWFLRKNFI